MYAYEKTALSTYSQTEAFIKSTRLAIKRGVRASYYSRKPATQIAEDIIELNLQLEEIEEFKNAIDESLFSLKPCYAYYLKTRYQIGDGKDVQVEKDAHYYRVVAYALGKFVAQMRSRGFTGEAFRKLFASYPYLESAYNKISDFETKVKSQGFLKIGEQVLKIKRFPTDLKRSIDRG